MEGNAPATIPAERCTTHDGAHSLYQGECIAVGAQVPRPFKPSRFTHACPNCGRETYGLTVPGGRRFVMDADSGDPHACQAPARVAIDDEALASGIASALFGLMERRREQHQPRPASPPAARAAVGDRPEPPQRPEPEMRPVTVWTEDATDGGGA